MGLWDSCFLELSFALSASTASTRLLLLWQPLQARRRQFHGLLAAGCAAQEGDLGLGAAEGFREEMEEFRVGFAIHRRRGEFDEKYGTAFFVCRPPAELGLASIGGNTNGKLGEIGSNGHGGVGHTMAGKTVWQGPFTESFSERGPPGWQQVIGRRKQQVRLGWR